mgnify:CR=1 FL=1
MNKSNQREVTIFDIDNNIIEIGDEIIFIRNVGFTRLIQGIVINIDYNYIYVEPNPEFIYRDIIKLENIHKRSSIQYIQHNIKILNKSKRILNLDQLKCQ